nr:TSUP family transporter [Agromyces seonyuensis]
MILFGIGIGVLSGLFGIGGGIIAVPGLINLFGVGDLLAKGTSLVIMFPTSVSGTISNWRAKLVDLRAGLVIGLVATAASFGGVAFAHWIPAWLSGWLFAALLLFAAWQMAVKAIKAQRQGK